MFSKPRKSTLHKQLDILQTRTTLSNKHQKTLERLATGYDGEMKFFQTLKSELTCSPLSLFDLLFEINGSECQVDCLLIFQHELFLFEIKNYEGDFIIVNHRWYTLAKKEIKNPLHQLQRTELLLTQLLNQHELPLKIHSFVVFIHPEFQLYEAPSNIPVIFPTQLKRFIRKLQHLPCQTNDYHEEFARLLKSKHQFTSSYEARLSYEDKPLKKGLTCGTCARFLEISTSSTLHCSHCQTFHSLEDALIRSIEEFHTLFPNKKITVAAINDWTNNQLSTYKIRKTLSSHGARVGRGKNTHYKL